MKKILIFIFSLIFFSLITTTHSKTYAYIGQCCKQTQPTIDCDQSSGPETCTGPLTAFCVGGGFTDTCQGQTGSCNPNGTLCDPSASPDPCCNGCQAVGPANYCGGVAPPTPPASTPVKPFQPERCGVYIPNIGPIEGIKTALGCIPTDPLDFINSFRGILIGIGSGIAFLMMIIGAFFIMVSQGQPERIQRGKEVFIGGLAGLLFMILSTFFLELIGIDILGLFRH